MNSNQTPHNAKFIPLIRGVFVFMLMGILAVLLGVYVQGKSAAAVFGKVIDDQVPIDKHGFAYDNNQLAPIPVAE